MEPDGTAPDEGFFAGDVPAELAFVARMWADDAASRALGMTVVDVGLEPHPAGGEMPGLGRSRVRMTVTESMVNGHATCHGGYLFTLCDSAFALACNAKGRATVASACDIDFVAAARLGDVLVAEGVERITYGRNGITDVTVTREGDGELVALFRGRSRTLARS